MCEQPVTAPAIDECKQGVGYISGILTQSLEILQVVWAKLSMVG